MHAEFSVCAVDTLHAMAEPQVQIVMLGALAIIFERLAARRLLRGARERQIADFQKFRRREKHHIDGIMVERIAKAPFVDHQRAHAGALGFDGAGQPRGPRSNANQIICAHEESVPREELFCNRCPVAQASACGG